MALITQTPQQYYNSPGSYGNYSLVSLTNIIDQFMFGYVGEDKVITRLKKGDAQFFAMRAIQELSFDTLVSKNAIEMDVPASLQMALPIDYVNYTKISWSDSSGVKHRIYPTNCKTGDPERYQQDSDGDYLFDLSGDLIQSGEMIDDGSSSLQGGPGRWELNVKIGSGTANTTVTVPTSNQTLSQGVGWFWDNNKIEGYNLPNNQGIRLTNVPIYSGEKYKITFTLSNFGVASRFSWVFRDENGDTYTPTTGTVYYTANGTYTETIDFSAANTTADNKEAQVIGFKQSQSSTAGTGCNVTIDNISLVHVGDEDSSSTWSSYSSVTPSENVDDDYQDDVYWPYQGESFGLDPQNAQVNGSFFIKDGKIYFSSNLSGKTIVLDYLSDGLAYGDEDGEIYVHKFAEEAIYKWIAYSVLSTRSGIPEATVRRYKKEKFAETRKAKLRLSNIKLAEISQVLRGKSKQIKH